MSEPATMAGRLQRLRGVGPLQVRIGALGLALALSVLAVGNGEAARKPVLGRLSDFAYVRSQAGPPYVFRMARSVKVAPAQFFVRYGRIWQLGALRRMVPTGAGVDLAGYSFTKYEEYYRGLPVVGSEMVLTERAGSVVFGLGVLASPRAVDTRPTITADAAIRQALGALAARSPGSSPARLLLSAPSANFVIERATRREARESVYRLAYRCSLKMDLPFGDTVVDVDARSGRILSATSPERETWITDVASGPTQYDGTQTFYAERSDTTGKWRLQSDPPFPAQTWDLQGATDTSVGYGISDDDGVFDTNVPGMRDAVSAQWGSQQVLKYLSDAFKQSGLNGDGNMPVMNLVRWGGIDNAEFLTFNGDPAVAYSDNPPQVDIDSIGHELGHGVVHYTSDLTYDYESGALNESFADIFGTLAEFAIKPAKADWVVGEDIYPGSGARSLQDPKQWCGDSDPETECQPDTYQGANWVSPNGAPTAANDWNGVHENSGVGNRWFYLLCQGGMGVNDLGNAYKVNGIGIDEAAQIAYNNVISLPSDATYAIAAENAIQKAIELYGEFSAERIATQDAWYAVGVGDKYQETPYASPQTSATSTPGDPWDAHFEWQAGKGETSWDVQVSTSADFTQELEKKRTSDTTANGKDGYLDMTLRPATHYYWRVRLATDDPKVYGWRQPYEFTTDVKRAKLTKPGSARGATNAYPWDLVFVWQPVAGAAGYTLEVSTSPGFSSSSLIFPAQTVHATDDRLSVKVNSTLWWRVRANGSPTVPNNYGAWSKPYEIKTSLPQAQLIEPIADAWAYPWHLKLRWKPVKGAAEYLVELTRNKGVFGAASLEKSLKILPATPGAAPATSIELNLKPVPVSKQEKHWWRVRVFGPKPLAEEGKPSAPGTFLNYGDGTAAQTVSPPDTHKLLVEEGVPVPDTTFVWNQVEGAEAYRLEIQAQSDNDRAVAPVVYSKTVPRDPASGGTQQLTVSFNNTPGLKPVEGITYYLWSVVAIGPEELEGLRSGTDRLFLAAPSPTQLSPPSGGTIQYDSSEILFNFTSVWTPSDKYLVTIYNNSGCLPNNLNSKFTIGQAHQHPDSGFSLANLQPAHQYSWSVQSYSALYADYESQGQILASDPNYLGLYASSCADFNTTAATPPAPTLICPSGGDQMPGTSVYFAWSEVPGATQYEFVISPPPYFSNSGDFTYTQGELDDIEGGKVLLDFGYDTFAVNTQYQWMVKAEVNGVWGDWSSPTTFVTGPSHWGDRNNDCAAVVQGP